MQNTLTKYLSGHQNVNQVTKCKLDTEMLVVSRY